MTKTFSASILAQAIAQDLLIISAESCLGDVLELIKQTHEHNSGQSGERIKSPRNGHLCVLVIADAQIVGILTQSDLLRLMVINSGGKEIRNEIKVAEVMTQPVITLRKSEVEDAFTPLNLLRQHHISYLPLVDEHNYPIGLFTLNDLLPIIDFTEINNHREKMQSESLLTAIANRIQTSLDLQIILDTTVQEIRQFLQTDRVIAYRFEPDWSGIIVAESVVPQWSSLLDRTITDPHFQEHMVEPYKNGRIQVTDNIYQGNLTECHRDFLIQIEVKAIIVVPILNGDQLWGLLAAQECAKVRHWEGLTISLLQNLATHIGIAIQQSSTMMQLQRLNQELESKIVKRTTALQNSENRLDLIVSNISEGILIANQEGRIVFANPSASRIFGIEVQQLKGILIGVPNIVHNQFEITYFSHDGKIGESEFQVVPITWDQEPAYLISIHDITERQQAEAKLLKTQMDLAEAQKIAHVGSWEFDVFTQTVSWSPELYRIFKLNPEEIELTYEEISKYFHPPDWHTLDDLITHAIKFGESYEVDLQIIRGDGSTGYIFAQGNPRRNAAGEISYLFGTALDISDRKQTEMQLQLTNQELSRATRLKDEFLANMSHELRTPLNAILGMTEGLQDEVFGSVNERQMKALQTVERSSSHLLALINDILDVAKIESGQIELDFAPTNISTLCQSSLAFIKQQSLNKRIQLEIKVPQDLPEQMLDERRMRQVLINLLNNAMKFTPEGGRISLEVSQQQNWLHFAIADTGIGISSDNIKKLFQPFVQIDSALNRQYTGTGLGLALVKQMVELHGGKVGLTSELGIGSCFTIDLPIVSDSISKAIASDQPLDQPLKNLVTDLPDAEYKQLSPLILIADDNDANTITVSSYLSAKGYRMILAQNGKEAIAMAKAHHPDIILMDIQMPVMDGLEAIKLIRLDPDLTKIPIIALTALAMPDDRERCLTAGASDYLAKPVKLKQLVSSIQQVLGVS
ncbi:PAS domain S-box [Synechococcus sp. PCC 7502]|uniref:ATP-binding protein n=1 Tax=Synechococcus sp. PCC 7502 TaxID=1173263 RepID=UPI00029FF1C7|nr:ATP-binding protein [Synechococcus sp. PCC 7502]AFY73306.1 PAS domain S-box [Synechococcus sp. PCC 7502]